MRPNVRKPYCTVCILLLTHALTISQFCEAANITVKAGDDIEIECHGYNISEGESNKLTWRWIPENGTEWIKVQSQNSLIETTSSLSTLTLLNVSLSDRGVYGCFIGKEEEPLNKNGLLVGYVPDQPSDIYCETNGFLSAMKCCWNVGRNTHLDTSYRLNYTIESLGEWHNFFRPTVQSDKADVLSVPCQLQNKDNGQVSRISCCKVAVKSPHKISDFEENAAKYLVTLVGANVLGEKKTKEHSESPFVWVKTDPPRNVSASVYEDNSASQISNLLVKWLKPLANTLIVLKYRLRYRISNGQDAWHTVTDISEESFPITHLHPNSQYEIQVAAKPINTWYGGYWSNWSISAYQTTDNTVPTTEFEFVDIIAKVNGASVSLEVDWQQYGSPDDASFYYKIICDGNMKNFSAHTTYAVFNVDSLVDFVISGSYCNSVGCSNSDTEVIAVSEAPNPAQNVHLSLSTNISTNMSQLTWKYDEESMDICSVGVYSSSGSIESNPNLIFGQPAIEHEVLCSSQISVFNFTSLSPCYEYLGFVSQKLKSGIQEIVTISPAAKSTSYNVVLEKTVTFSAVASEKNFEFRVSWLLPDHFCQELNSDFGLWVKYSPVSGAECINKASCPPEESFYKQIEHCYQGDQYTSVSNNVHGFTTYQIGLHACCSSSSTTPTNCQQISQKLSLVQTIAGAPTKPTDVLWNPGNPVYISWEAPQHPNGNLNGYYVQYGLINEDTAMEDLKTVNMQSETKILCSDANNQSIYWAKVTAYNMNSDKTMVYGNYSYKEGMPCASNIAATPVVKLIDTGLLVGLALGIAALIATFAFTHYHRKKIKRAFRKTLWPPVPNPNIYVGFYNEGSNYNGINNTFLSVDERLNNEGGYTDNTIEIPVDIRDTTLEYTPEPIQETDTTKQISSECSSLNEHNLNNNNNDKSSFHCTDSAGTNMDSAYTYSTCMPYSVVSPLLESRDNSGQISSGSSSWRSILYPRASAHMNAEHRPPARRSSFCESTTSRGMESYVRYCRQSNRQPNTNQCSDFDPKDPLPSPVITYTRIAVGEDGSPTFLPDSNQNLLGAFRFPPSSGINGGADRRCRGESWYGGFSNEEDSHFPKEELEYKGSLASYVAEVDSNPTAHSDHKFHSKCTTETEPETFEVNNDYGSTDSIDRLYHGRHRGHLGMEVAPHPAPSEEVVMPQAGYITVGEAMTLGGNGTEISATLSSSSESGPFDLFNIQDSTEEEASHENLDDFLRQDSEPNADLNEDWSLHSQHNAVENDYITAVNADDALH